MRFKKEIMKKKENVLLTGGNCEKSAPNEEKENALLTRQWTVSIEVPECTDARRIASAFTPSSPD